MADCHQESFIRQENITYQTSTFFTVTKTAPNTVISYHYVLIFSQDDIAKCVKLVNLKHYKISSVSKARY